jgi:hypothetical protein
MIEGMGDGLLEAGTTISGALGLGWQTSMSPAWCAHPKLAKLEVAKLERLSCILGKEQEGTLSGPRSE